MFRIQIISALLSALMSTLAEAIDDQEAKEIIDDVLDLIEDRHPIIKSAVARFRRIAAIPDDIGGDDD